MSPPTLPPPAQLLKSATAYFESSVLNAAVELSLFDHLNSAIDGEEVARRAGTSAGHTIKLLDALSGMGIVRKAGGKYELDGGMKPFLLASSPMSLIPALRLSSAMYGLWSQLGKVVKSGEAFAPHGRDENAMRNFVMGMHSRGMLLLPPVADAIDLSGCTRVLDAGSGPGTLSRMLARKHPESKFTLQDLPPVNGIARELTKGDPSESRVEFIDGSYLKSLAGGKFDAIVYCGALHQHELAPGQELMSRFHDSLNDGGRLFVIDMFVENDRTTPLFSAMFALNMMMISSGTRVWTCDEAMQALHESAFTNVRVDPKPAGIYRVISAHRGR